ncbi:Mo-dependent nitrogenase C-terminal domain-containing protein [Synechocystis sp. LKSZ1]|uniref:Mo-dependent nitrogenase C-terminal domain-containing protein n=1 Tax=Synechocystis sp. LKSZ1 TaxID=3144951 RepID=UPI00336C29D1
MVSTSTTPYSNVQMATWLRGLLTIAWADGDFTTEEQTLITELVKEMGFQETDTVLFKAIHPEELVEGLGKDKATAENFLRTAVLVAIADGLYSPSESTILHDFCEALGIKIQALEALEHTLCDPESQILEQAHPHPDLLHPMKDWLDGMAIHDPRLARFICKLVPPQCPFERDVTLFGHKLVHIPPLCKLNPLYEQLVGLRFRALSYLADDCKEDISDYI